ncbi:PAS domain-containing protein cky-1 isoform X1 [Daktulosphaira vitifoliae]|uniref:PAS domain-containing protein cky-1 isoform X1 n=2 Tax=Daktulosphaira vitifoliae TaxID=58002 RepID=UPI0021A9AA93|nr:PAS domain-containing protein cky-1 isoform X1 [Daktulosphaira vitifoliae]
MDFQANASNMFTRFDATKSTKGASKLRRDLINAEIANLRDLLPLPPSTRQRLSQLQLMALVCVYVRKANYFQQAFKRHECLHHHCLPTPGYGFSKALSGFLMMMTQNGKLLYISDNAAEYLGHSMEDLLIHGDSVYDMIDKQDHQAVQTELSRSQTSAEDLGCKRMFLCRMNVSRNARRQMRFGDQKVVLVQGHYLSYLPLCSRNEPVFLATCSPVAMPETREAVVQGSTTVFTAIHSMDMKFIHVDKIGEFHLGFSRAELQGVSWYQLLHWECMREAQSKHRLITQSEQDRSCILLARIQKRTTGDWLWIHCVLQVKDNMENSQQPVIVSTNQVLTDQEAAVMRSNSWLYHYYMVQSKLQYGMQFDTQTSPRVPSVGPTSSTQSTSSGPVYAYQQPPLQHRPQQLQHVHESSPYSTEPQQPQHFHQLPDSYFRYANGRHRLEPEPVDYSLHSPEQTPPPPLTMKTEESADSPVSPMGAETGGCTATALSLPSATSLGRSRALVKAAMDPGDMMMDTWNPSPPWSDCCSGTQKVPDVDMLGTGYCGQPTPPTPGSGGSYHLPTTHQNTSASQPSTFTFDWSGEQYVPNVHEVLVEPPPHYIVPFPPWPQTVDHHRLFPLQPPPVGTLNRPSLIVRLDQDTAADTSVQDGRESDMS